MNPFLAQIKMFGGTFAPRGWAYCDGQLLSINAYQALFSILGTTYGGDGRTSFALPDLRGRTPVSQGTGPGLSNINLGQRGGAQSVTLNATNLPNHTHSGSIKVSNAAADDDSQGASASIGKSEIFVEGTPNTDLADGSVALGNTGGQQAFDIRNPFLGTNYIIALQGVFPSRN